jgi:hypothetical protein
LGSTAGVSGAGRAYGDQVMPSWIYDICNYEPTQFSVAASVVAAVAMSLWVLTRAREFIAVAFSAMLYLIPELLRQMR